MGAMLSHHRRQEHRGRGPLLQTCPGIVAKV